MNNKSDHEEARETLWREVLVAATRSESSLDPATCVHRADTALAQFDARFSPEAHQARQEKLKQQETVKREKEKGKKGSGGE